MDGWPARPASGDSGGGDQHERVMEELDRLERALLEGQHAEREVERAGSKELEQALVAVGLGEPDLDVGPRLAEAADDRRQHPRSNALVHPDAQRAGLAGRVREEIGAGGLEAVRDRLHVALEQPAGLGELDRPAAPTPVEQPDAERRLEPHDVLADRRLRVVEGVGRPVEGPLVRHGAEAQQLPKAEVREGIREHRAARGPRCRRIISCHDVLLDHIRLL